MMAGYFDHPKVVKLLIEKGANIDIIDLVSDRMHLSVHLSAHSWLELFVKLTLLVTITISRVGAPCTV
jgi:ankyrin repeat protein